MQEEGIWTILKSTHKLQKQIKPFNEQISEWLLLIYKHFRMIHFNKTVRVLSTSQGKSNNNPLSSDCRKGSHTMPSLPMLAELEKRNEGYVVLG